MTFRGRAARVLILSGEPMGAALLGLLVEAEAYEPAFAHPGESPEAALNRVRPLLVILLDEGLDVADSDIFYTRAERAGVRVVLWGVQDRARETHDLARSRRLTSFSVPITRAELASVLAVATESDDRRDTARERRVPPPTPDSDALIFTDRSGQRWYVYDRRSGERRHTDDRVEAIAQSGPSSYRVFVNETGEEWRYRLTDEEHAEASAEALERQLAAAMRAEDRA